MAVPFQDGLSQFFDDSGNPLAGGLVYTYAAGTTTPVATYTNRSGGVEHENPVELDSAGRASIWLDRSTAYRFDVKSADDALIDSVDNVILTDGSSAAFLVETFTATEGQTVITLAGTYTTGLNAIAVYVGIGGAMYLVSGVDYTETNGQTVTLTDPLAAGETVTVIYGNQVSTNNPVYHQLACSDLTSTLTSGPNKAYVRAPAAFRITGISASLLTASATGAVTVDINVNGSTILSTKLTIDQDEKTSKTAATPHVVSTAAVANDDEITVDIDSAGASAKGLIVTIQGVLA